MRIRQIAVVAPIAVFVAAQALAQPSIASAREQAMREYRRAMAEARELYQGRNRGADQSDTVSRKIRIGRNGQVTIQNVSGTITVTAGSGDEVTIDAVKRARGDREQLDRVDVIIEEHPGRVDIRTDYRRGGRFNNTNAWVDYTVVVPDGASVDLKSISGEVKVTGVKGSVRVQSISGAVTATGTPRVELAKTVSGSVELSGVSSAGDLTATTVSGSIHVNGVKAHSFDANTVSGEISLRDAAVERFSARSISGAIEYNGELDKNGQYEGNSHSGSARFTLSGNPGFELNATTFSGEI